MALSYGRTQEQYDNLQKLINGFKALPSDYVLLDMELFALNRAEAQNATPANPCTSLMCVVGHGPSFGIPFIKEDDCCWLTYAWRVFGMRNSFEYNLAVDSRRKVFFCGAWDFCFSYRWSNSINETIARLELAQRGEIPSEWDHNGAFVEVVQ